MKLPEPDFADMYGVKNSYTADTVRQAIDDALEEAARLSESLWGDGDANDIAQEIRALKEKQV
jgi:hypothetical protein